MDLEQTANGESSPAAGHLRGLLIFMPENDNIKRLRTFELVHFDCQFLHQD